MKSQSGTAGSNGASRPSSSARSHSFPLRSFSSKYILRCPCAVALFRPRYGTANCTSNLPSAMPSPLQFLGTVFPQCWAPFVARKKPRCFMQKTAQSAFTAPQSCSVTRHSAQERMSQGLRKTVPGEMHQTGISFPTLTRPLHTLSSPLVGIDLKQASHFCQ